MEKASIKSLGFEPRKARWQMQTHPLGYICSICNPLWLIYFLIAKTI